MATELKLTKEDLIELEEFKKRNFQERMDFIAKHVEWMKSHPKEWSEDQNRVINWQMKDDVKMTPEILIDMQSGRTCEKMNKVENRTRMQRSKVR